MIRRKNLYRALPLLLLFSCSQAPLSISKSEFENLMQQLANAWSAQDTNAAVSCFTENATYMQPPAEQYYKGHDQFRLYFGALKPGTTMTFHSIWFDEAKQTGAGEFTFGNSKTNTGVTGVCIVTIKDKKIDTWREYFISGPINFEEFISTEGKEWKWHIGNYP
jgi:ketosteroid isomerase-like protein